MSKPVIAFCSSDVCLYSPYSVRTVLTKKRIQALLPSLIEQSVRLSGIWYVRPVRAYGIRNVTYASYESKEKIAGNILSHVTHERQRENCGKHVTSCDEFCRTFLM